MPDQPPDPRTVIDTWDRILSARRPANGGHPVHTDRGAEPVFKILATGRDLDDLRAALSAWKADRERLALAEAVCETLRRERATVGYYASPYGTPLADWTAARDRTNAALADWAEALKDPVESTRHHGTLVDEARAAIRRVAGDPSADAARLRASLDDLRSLCGHLLMRVGEIVEGNATS